MAPVHWFIDGNNVMGAAGDGWWNDPVAAAVRLTDAVARWCREHDDAVTLIFDGPAEPAVARLGGGNLEVGFATRRGRDAADDRIVELVEARVDGDTAEAARITVVSSDRGLLRRLPEGVGTLGAGTFRGRAGLDDRARRRDR